MLTVNHIDIDHIETLYEAANVRYSNKIGQAAQEGYEPLNGAVEVFFKPVSLINQNPVNNPEESVFLYGGNVFVMNEEGRTVAKYELGGWRINVPENVQIAS